MMEDIEEDEVVAEYPIHWTDPGHGNVVVFQFTNVSDPSSCLKHVLCEQRASETASSFVIQSKRVVNSSHVAHLPVMAFPVAHEQEDGIVQGTTMHVARWSEPLHSDYAIFTRSADGSSVCLTPVSHVARVAPSFPPEGIFQQKHRLHNVSSPQAESVRETWSHPGLSLHEKVLPKNKEDNNKDDSKIWLEKFVRSFSQRCFVCTGEELRHQVDLERSRRLRRNLDAPGDLDKVIRSVFYVVRNVYVSQQAPLDVPEPLWLLLLYTLDQTGHVNRKAFTAKTLQKPGVILDALQCVAQLKEPERVWILKVPHAQRAADDTIWTDERAKMWSEQLCNWGKAKPKLQMNAALHRQSPALSRAPQAPVAVVATSPESFRQFMRDAFRNQGVVLSAALRRKFESIAQNDFDQWVSEICLQRQKFLIPTEAFLLQMYGKEADQTFLQYYSVALDMFLKPDGTIGSIKRGDFFQECKRRGFPDANSKVYLKLMGILGVSDRHNMWCLKSGTLQ